jgi:uncharacterized membrane protein YcjF (UPF0283 family)
MRYFKRFVFLFTLFFVYLVVREFLSLYHQLIDLHPWLGYSFLFILIIFLAYWVLWPVFRLMRMRVYPGPVRKDGEVDKLEQQRLQIFRRRGAVKAASYAEHIAVREKQCRELRNATVRDVFYTTSMAQNGFLDAMIILGSAIQLLRETYIIYNGRAGYAELIDLSRHIYVAMLVGGSEGSELATEEIFSRLSTESMRSIPFIDKIMSSLADGYINALLINRIGLIAENYFTMRKIDSDRDLRPPASFVIGATSDITAGIINDISRVLKAMAGKNIENFGAFAARPVHYVFRQASSGYVQAKRVVGKGKSLLGRVLRLLSSQWH